MSANGSRGSESRTPTEDSPKIALIGCGAIAELYYLPALAKHRSVLGNLVLVDRNRARARELATRFKVREHLVDYRELLDEVDGAIVALPIALHHPVSMEFLSRGVHVLCEKPLAESAEKARAMVEEARKSGAVLSVNYLQRLVPSFVKVKQLLANNTLGEPLSVKYFVGEKFDWPTVSGFYFNSDRSARGVLRDRGAHVFDHICWWLGGKPRVVTSQNDSFGGSEAVAYVEFRYGNCVGEVMLSWLGNFPCRIVIKCERGTIEGDVYDYSSISVISESGLRKRLRLSRQLKSDMAVRIVTNFIRCVSGGERPLVAGSDVVDSIQFIDDCYEAATRFDMPWYDLLEVASGS